MFHADTGNMPTARVERTAHPAFVVGCVVHEPQHLRRDLLRVAVDQRSVGVRQERLYIWGAEVDRQTAGDQRCHHSTLSATSIFYRPVAQHTWGQTQVVARL